MAQGMDERITLEKLQQLKQRAIHCGRLEELEIDGLTLERALVFPSGLAILIAIFTELNIQCMTPQVVRCVKAWSTACCI